MEQLNEPSAAQNTLSEFLTTTSYRRVILDLLKTAGSDNHYLQACKILELEILYNTTEAVDEYEYKDEVIEYLLNLSVTNEKGKLVPFAVEKGKLILWTLVQLLDRDSIIGTHEMKKLHREALVDSFPRLLFIKEPPPTDRDFNDVVAIGQQLYQLLNSNPWPWNYGSEPIWYPFMNGAKAHFHKFGNFKKTVRTIPKIFNPTFCLTVEQETQISDLKQKLKIRKEELTNALKKREERLDAELKAMWAAEDERKAAEAAKRKKEKRANATTIFERDPDFFANFKRLLNMTLGEVGKIYWMNDLHIFFKNWEKLRAEWTIEQLFSEMFQYLEERFEKDVSLCVPFVRVFVEFLSIPILKYGDVSETFHKRFHRFLLEASENFPQQARLLKEVRILYTSLGYNLEDDNSSMLKTRENIFYKIQVSISSFTAIKSELVQLPNDAHSSQRQKISELIYIYRKSPENELAQFLKILVTNETKGSIAKLLLWVFVELLDKRIPISVDPLATLFQQSILPDWTRLLFKELVSIRQELAFKLPVSTDFSKIDEIGSSCQKASWISAISSAHRKPGMYYYQNLNPIEERKIEIIQAFLKHTLTHDNLHQTEEISNPVNQKKVIFPKILAGSDNTMESEPEKNLTITKLVSKRSISDCPLETIDKKKTILTSQEIEKIKERMINVCHTNQNFSNSSQIKINTTTGECSSCWTSSIIPSKDSIISSSNPPTIKKKSNQLGEKDEVFAWTNGTSGKVFAEIKKKLIKSQTYFNDSSSRIIGDKMEVIPKDDFITGEYVDQILSPSFLGQEMRILDGKLVMVLTHSLKYHENKRKLN